MADKKKVLLVTQAMTPYLADSELGKIVHQYATFLQDQNVEVRILMPRFGLINERRHRLHEVVRLSGMNITVDEDDYPLIIKVASLPGTRMQVYFLDNDEFFKRKQLFSNDKGKAFDDNLERMLFFSKGVVETVKKFGWSPDIVHGHGWMTSLLPAYLRLVYKDEPIFQNSRVVYSAYGKDPVENNFQEVFEAKLETNQLGEALKKFYNSAGDFCLNAGAAFFADGLIDAGAGIDTTPDLPFLQADSSEMQEYLAFYEQLALQEEKLP